MINRQTVGISTEDVLGVNYDGEANTTRSGYTCQNWSAKSPHRSTVQYFFSPDHNFCRNPGPI